MRHYLWWDHIRLRAESRAIFFSFAMRDKKRKEETDVWSVSVAPRQRCAHAFCLGNILQVNGGASCVCGVCVLGRTCVLLISGVQGGTLEKRGRKEGWKRKRENFFLKLSNFPPWQRLICSVRFHVLWFFFTSWNVILLELLSASHSSFSTPRESDKLKRLGIFFYHSFLKLWQNR